MTGVFGLVHGQPGVWKTQERRDIVTPVTETHFFGLIPDEFYQLILEILISASTSFRFVFNECTENVYQYALHQAGRDGVGEHEYTQANAAYGIILGLNIVGTHYLVSAQFCALKADPTRAMLVAQGFNYADDTHFSVINGGGLFPNGDTVILNGVFAADTDWAKGDGWTIAGGVAHCDGTQITVSNLTQASRLIQGHYYKVTFDVLNYVAGAVRPRAGLLGDGTYRSANNTYTEILQCIGNENFYFLANADFEGDIDNVIVEPQITSIGLKTSSFTGKLVLQRLMR